MDYVAIFAGAHEEARKPSIPAVTAEEMDKLTTEPTVPDDWQESPDA